jgi:hypothetical protein
VPLGLRLFTVGPQPHTVRQILWNADWQPDRRAGDDAPLPPHLRGRGAWQAAYAAAVVHAAGADLLLDARVTEAEAPAWDADTRWHDVRAELDRPAWLYATRLSGRELKALQATVRDSLQGMALYPALPGDHIADGRTYEVVLSGWTARDLAQRLHRNLANVEWRPVPTLWTAFRDASLELPPAARAPTALRAAAQEPGAPQPAAIKPAPAPRKQAAAKSTAKAKRSTTKTKKKKTRS